MPAGGTVLRRSALRRFRPCRAVSAGWCRRFLRRLFVLFHLFRVFIGDDRIHRVIDRTEAVAVHVAVLPHNLTDHCYIVSVIALFDLLFLALRRIDLIYGAVRQRLVLRLREAHLPHLVLPVSQHIHGEGPRLIDRAEVDRLRQIVHEAEIQIIVRHGRILPDGHIGHRREMAGALRHGQTGQQHRIEKGGAHLTDAAPASGTSLPSIKTGALR